MTLRTKSVFRRKSCFCSSYVLLNQRLFYFLLSSGQELICHDSFLLKFQTLGHYFDDFCRVPTWSCEFFKESIFLRPLSLGFCLSVNYWITNSYSPGPLLQPRAHFTSGCWTKISFVKILESPDQGTPQRSLGDSNGAPKMFLQSDLSQLV